MAFLAALTLGGAASCRHPSGSGQDANSNDRPSPEIPGESDRAGERPKKGQRPPEISTVFPEKNSTACAPPEVSVGFSLSGAMLKNGQMDVSAFSLTLDGRDVTPKTDVRGTMNFPQSRGVLFYKPGTPLSPGRHEARVTFPEKTGNARVYTWSFGVTKASCK